MAKIKSFVDFVMDKYGDSYFVNDFNTNTEVIPTGSLALDVSIGVGGIPKGRYTEIYGPESAGKTTLALSLVRQAILQGDKRVLYIETENNLNPNYVKTVLGDLYSKDQVFIQPKTANAAFDIAIAGVKDKFNLIIVDSFGSLTPEKELEDEFEAQHVGLVPRLVSKFLRDVNYDLRTNNVAFVCLNQVRANIGGYGSSFSTPAGHALKHFTSLRVMVTKGKEIKASASDENAIGNIVNFTIKKNKMGMPFRSAFTNIIYGEGIDYYRDVLNFGQLLGAVESKGSYLAFEGKTISSRPGIANAIQTLKDDKETLDKIVKTCYTIANVEFKADAALVASDED